MVLYLYVSDAYWWPVMCFKRLSMTWHVFQTLAGGLSCAFNTCRWMMACHVLQTLIGDLSCDSNPYCASAVNINVLFPFSIIINHLYVTVPSGQWFKHVQEWENVINKKMAKSSLAIHYEDLSMVNNHDYGSYFSPPHPLWWSNVLLS